MQVLLVFFGLLTLFSTPFSFLFFFFKIDVKLISVYHPTSEETFVTTNASMEGFFEGVEIVAKAMTSATTAVAGEISTKASVPPSKAFLLRIIPLLREASLGSPPLFLPSLLPLRREPLLW